MCIDSQTNLHQYNNICSNNNLVRNICAMKTHSEKYIWLTAALLCTVLYILSEKVEIAIWIGITVIMFRLAMVDEQINNKKL